MGRQSVDYPQTPYLHSPSTRTIAFASERGSGEDEAIQVYFGANPHYQAKPLSYRTFADVFCAVASGEVDNGFVPVENALTGSFNDVYDLLRQHDLFAVGEMSYQITYCLLGLPGQQLRAIKRVIAHPQAQAQCDVFLRELGAEIVTTYDSPGSLKKLCEDHPEGVAAIVSANVAALYHLEILVRGIQTIKDNATRSIVLGREPFPRDGKAAKTMLVLATTHQPGSLYRCLHFLAAYQVNLLKIVSRPSRQRPWEYVFYLDIEGHREDPKVRSALARLAEHTTFCKVLGSFARSV